LSTIYSGVKVVHVDRRLEGKACVVTGAARGIGRGIASRLAAEGASVYLVDRAEAVHETAAELAREHGARVVGRTADVTDRASVREALAVLDHVDVLFNNAGISQAKRFLEIGEDEWQRMMDVNALGVLIGIQEAAKRMIDRGAGGKIVNTASIAGRQGQEYFAHYSASKFAVVGLTQAAARALGRHGITVNAICPGVVATEMWDKADEELMELGLAQRPGQAMEEFAGQVILGRVSTPADVAAVAAFLASDDSGYITGQSIMVDGGMVLL
jgi:meso-butanediol dehydrogenase/(S,S)-butanediol dehydrogenase/diacetyl reductase